MLSDRLNQFIEYKNITSSQFADAAGVPRPTLSQLLTGRSKSINDLMLSKIHAAFPELNVSWLLFGEGVMLIGETQLSNSNESANSRSKIDVKPDNYYENPSMAHDEEQAPYGYPLPRHISPSNRKEISKIVIFYTDSTFEEYGPK